MATTGISQSAAHNSPRLTQSTHGPGSHIWRASVAQWHHFRSLKCCLFLSMTSKKHSVVTISTLVLLNEPQRGVAAGETVVAD